MIGFVWSHLRGRAGRTLALLAGVLAATTGFTVLTGATATARLQVTGTVNANARAAYDILVRPAGTRRPLETQQGLVRPNYLSGVFGGLTMGQYDEVRAITGVDVAAPIAMVGYANAGMQNEFDITDLVDRGLTRQVIRVDPTFLADRGLSRGAGQPSYVYITRDRVSWLLLEKSSLAHDEFSGGETVDHDPICQGAITALDYDAHGHAEPICSQVFGRSDLLTDRQVDEVRVVRLRDDGTFEVGPGLGGTPTVASRLAFRVATHLPVLLAGIDPDAEARLVGLRGAVDTGRYLTPADHTVTHPGSTQTPVLGSSRNYVDTSTSVAISRLPVDTPVAGVRSDAVLPSLGAAPRQPLGQRQENGGPAFQRALAKQLQGLADPAELNHLMQTGAPQYDRAPDGSLVVRDTPPDPGAYRTPGQVGLVVPWQIDDTSFRSVTPVPMSPEQVNTTHLVGTFDPDRISGFSDLGAVPMETYQPPGVTGADQRSRYLLGGRSLVPDGNPGGYVAAPPLLLTNLAAVPGLLRQGGTSAMADKPISAIRVRVAGVRGFSAASRERVRVVAEQIAALGGLDVDITYGSSAAPQTVQLPAGAYGRPALRLTEEWSKKGVAAAIINAVDRKSAVLFLLVLIVCAMFLGNAVTAGVRDRRAELATLSCLGWPAYRIGLALLGEVLAIGAAAGLLGLALSAPLAALLGIRLTWAHALLAIPIALALTLLAGAGPAWRGARAHPAGALRPPAGRTDRAGRTRTVLGFGLGNLARVPGRTMLGAGALAVGIAALSLLIAVTYAFRGAVVGTVLGDAVSLQARGVDTVAVVATVVLGGLAVGDVLYLNIRDRAAELAALRATGWSDAALGRLVTYEGLGIGVIGAVLGTGLGVGAAAWFAGGVTRQLLTTGGLAALVGVLVAGAAALVPALLLRRRPITQLLAEE